MKTDLTQEQIDAYQRDGCLIVKEFLTTQELDELISAVSECVKQMGKWKVAGDEDKKHVEGDTKGLPNLKRNLNSVGVGATMDIEKLEPPLSEALIAEIIALWEAVFDTTFQGFRSILRGEENADNHNWRLLDANVGLFSTRYKVQSSCMGLYPRYQALLQENCGSFFEARAEKGSLVGLSTARLEDPKTCRVDGFTHGSHTTIWNELINAAVRWGAERGAERINALVALEDEVKRAAFKSLDFSQAAAGPDFSLEDREIPSVRLEMAVPRE